MDVAGEVIAGRYELEELTGSGGMSRVYRARDNQLGRLVAVKILHQRFADDAEHVERFRREALAVARLNHPNIVTVIDRGEADGVQFIVFEHVEGEDLKRLITRTGPLPVRRALELGVQIGRALSFAHANGVVHRDVKPQNVLVRDGNAKVTDFGIARADHLELDVEHTESGTVLGTGDYISPEQARGERASERSDVYSLGALLYELLTGDVPYPAESAVAAALRHTTDPVPDVLAARPDVPVRVAGAVERALAKDPGDRFPTMDAFVDELVACRNELPEPDAAQTMILPHALPAPAPLAAGSPRRRVPRHGLLGRPAPARRGRRRRVLPVAPAERLLVRRRHAAPAARSSRCTRSRRSTRRPATVSSATTSSPTQATARPRRTGRPSATRPPSSGT